MYRIIHFSKFFFILYSTTTLFSCKDKDPSDMKFIFEKPSPGDSLSFYFPLILNDTLHLKDPFHREFRQNWYSSALYSFKEPILYNKTDSQTIYRLLWLRSFHQPVCFTIKEFDGDYFINTKTLDRQPAFYPQIERRHINAKQSILDTFQKADRLAFITFDTIIVLKRGQWKEIEGYLSKLEFWNKSIAAPNGAARPSDGAEWILEGRTNGDYHFRTWFDADGELRALGKYLIKLSGLIIKDKDFY